MISPKNMILAIGVLALLMVLGGTFIAWPNYREAADVRRQTHELKAKMNGLQGQARALGQLAEEVRLTKARIEYDLKEIPAAPDVAELIRKLSLGEDEATLIDQEFTAGSPGEAIIGGKESVQAMPLTMEAKGRFDSIFALLRIAESMDRLVRIASVHIQCKREEQTGDTPILTASIGLEAIFDPPADQEKP